MWGASFLVKNAKASQGIFTIFWKFFGHGLPRAAKPQPKDLTADYADYTDMDRSECVHGISHCLPACVREVLDSRTLSELGVRGVFASLSTKGPAPQKATRRFLKTTPVFVFFVAFCVRLFTADHTDDTDFLGSARRGDLQQEQQSTEGNEDSEGFFKSSIAFVFFVAFCKNLLCDATQSMRTRIPFASFAALPCKIF